MNSFKMTEKAFHPLNFRHFNVIHPKHKYSENIILGMAVVGAIAAGPVSDRFGRRPVIIMSSLVFTVGGVVCAAAPEKVTLLVGRILLGFGIGLSIFECQKNVSN